MPYQHVLGTRIAERFLSVVVQVELKHAFRVWKALHWDMRVSHVIGLTAWFEVYNARRQKRPPVQCITSAGSTNCGHRAPQCNNNPLLAGKRCG